MKSCSNVCTNFGCSSSIPWCKNATGFGSTEAQAFSQYKGDDTVASVPKALPCQCIDHAAGQLLAFGHKCGTLQDNYGASWSYSCPGVEFATLHAHIGGGECWKSEFPWLPLHNGCGP